VATLFNIYFNAVVSVWHEQCGEIGVPVLYKCWWVSVDLNLLMI